MVDLDLAPDEKEVTPFQQKHHRLQSRPPPNRTCCPRVPQIIEEIEIHLMAIEHTA